MAKFATVFFRSLMAMNLYFVMKVTSLVGMKSQLVKTPGASRIGVLIIPGDSLVSKVQLQEIITSPLQSCDTKHHHARTRGFAMSTSSWQLVASLFRASLHMTQHSPKYLRPDNLQRMLGDTISLARPRAVRPGQRCLLVPQTVQPIDFSF